MMTRLSRSTALALAGSWVASAAARPVVAQTLPTVRLIGGPIEPTSGGYWAYEMGFFKKAGLEVEVQQARSGNVEAAAVAGGRVDVGDSNVVSFAQAVARGVPFVAIAPGEDYTSRDPMTILAEAPNAAYRTAKDLNGQTVAVISLNSIAHLGVACWMERNGGDLSSLKLVEVTSAEVVPALQNGRIAAGVLSEPQMSTQADQMRVLAKLFDALAPHFLISVWFTTKDWAAQHPDIPKRFSEAIRQANDWASHNPERARAIQEKWDHIKVIASHYTYSPALEPAMIQPVLDAGARYKIIPRQLNAGEMIWSG